jgi:hypothetical protein
MSHSPDHVYIDLAIVNNDNTGAGVKKNLEFTQNRSSSFLHDAGDYSMAVARFSVDSPNTSVPVIIPLLNVDGKNSDINQTVYTISMAQVVPGGFSGQLDNLKTINIEFSPEDISAPLPNNLVTSTVTRTTQISTINDPTMTTVSNTTNVFAIENGEYPAGLDFPAFDGSSLNYFLFSLKWFLGNFLVRANFGPVLRPCIVLTNMVIDFPYNTNQGDIVITPSTGYVSSGGALITAPITVSYPVTINGGSAFTWIFPLVSTSGYTIGSYSNNANPVSYSLRFDFSMYPFVSSPAPTLLTSASPGFFPGDPIQVTTANNITFVVPPTQISFPVANFNITVLAASFTFQKNTPSFSSQDISTGYYSIYSPQWFISMINNALSSLWTQYSDYPNTSRVKYTEQSAPFFVFDPLTGMPTLLTPLLYNTMTLAYSQNFAVNQKYVTGGSGGADNGYPLYLGGNSNPKINYVMFFNEPLMNLFSSLPSIYYGNNFAGINGPKVALIGNSSNVFVNPADQATALANPWLFSYYIQPINYNNLNVTAAKNGLAGLSYITTLSEYSPLPQWSPVQSVQFTSTLMPNLNSYSTLEVPFNQLGGVAPSGNNSAITNKITDIQISLVNGLEYKPTINYVPKGEYRFVELLGHQSIQFVDFSVSWLTKYGQVIPFRLGSQCSASLKVLFRRKRFNLLNIQPYGTAKLNKREPFEEDDDRRNENPLANLFIQ